MFRSERSALWTTTRIIKVVRARGVLYKEALTVSQDPGLVRRAEADIVEDEERQAGAAPEPEPAHLRQQVQAAVQPQEHLLPLLPERQVQEQLQPEDGQVAEMSVPSFRQRERQEVL